MATLGGLKKILNTNGVASIDLTLSEGERRFDEHFTLGSLADSATQGWMIKSFQDFCNALGLTTDSSVGNSEEIPKSGGVAQISDPAGTQTELLKLISLTPNYSGVVAGRNFAR